MTHRWSTKRNMAFKTDRVWDHHNAGTPPPRPPRARAKAAKSLPTHVDTEATSFLLLLLSFSSSSSSSSFFFFAFSHLPLAAQFDVFHGASEPTALGASFDHPPSLCSNKKSSLTISHGHLALHLHLHPNAPAPAAVRPPGRVDRGRRDVGLAHRDPAVLQGRSEKKKKKLLGVAASVSFLVV